MGLLDDLLISLSRRIYWLRSIKVREGLRSALSGGVLPLMAFAYTSFFLNIKLGRSKKPNWIFFESHTHSFCDNAKYLYLYIHNRGLYDKCLWISFDYHEVEALRRKGFPAVNASPSLYLSARVIVSSGSRAPYEVGRWIRFVSLWHGIPIKSIFWLNTNDKGLYGGSLRKALYFLADPHLFAPDYLLLAPPSIFKEVFQMAFNIDQSKLILGPYPRNFVFIDRLYGEEINAYTPEDFPEGKTIILYLPTYREYRLSMDITDVLPLSEINEVCRRYDALFLIKTHFFEDITTATRNYERIVILDNSKDIYPLLRRVDILITDYSSVALDFLYADKPILFYPYDFEDYVKHRAQYIDYDLMTPGPKARSPKELLDSIIGALEGEDEYKHERSVIRKLVWGNMSELRESHFRRLATKIIDLATVD